MRIVFRYTGAGAAPTHDVARIKAIAGLQVVDETPRMMLVEADWKLVQVELPFADWVTSEETKFEIPEERPQARE